MEKNIGYVSKKTAAVVVISIILFTLIAMTVIASGHYFYEKNTMTEITNISNFTKIAPRTYIYGYADDKINVDMCEIVKISNNASLSVLTVKEKESGDKYNIINKTGNMLINVSDKIAKYVTVKIANGKKYQQYIIVLVAKSNQSNTIFAHNVEAEGGFLDVYNSGSDYILPAPVKNYKSDVATYNFDFEGWYTTPEFHEDTKIDIIPAGSSGICNLYAKFKTTSRQFIDGKYYYIMGEYPQTRVTNYAHLGALKVKAAADLTTDNGIFYCNVDGSGDKKYFRFKPKNTLNVANNGYSPSSYYYFMVEPIEWIFLTKNEPISGGTYQLLTRKIINCSMFVDSTAASIFESLGDSIKKLIENNFETFMESIYGPESLWWRSDARQVTNAMFAPGNSWLTSDEIATLTPRAYTAYYTNVNISFSNPSLNIVPDKKEVNDEKIYCLEYTDMTNTNYGFSDDEYIYDSARRATVTDFAKANGAYFVTNARYKNVGTYFLRGAGSRYTYEHKRFAYVKYTGAVHCYATTSWKIRSGIRPTCKATVSF